jgi:hypothetical protein
MFISRYYKDKMWCVIERKAAILGAGNKDSEYILPARFDDTEIEGIPNDIAHIDLRSHSSKELSIFIAEKLGINFSNRKANEVAPMRSAARKGQAIFDYSNYDGKYEIGDGSFSFITKWSKASGDSIHCYNDGTNIRALSEFTKFSDILSVTDMSLPQFTSRCRTVSEGGYMLLQNQEGFYAILKILDIKDKSRSDDRDELLFEYYILDSLNDCANIDA